VDSAPTLELSAPVSDAVYSDGEAITFAATVSDEQDSPTAIAVSWVSDLDGEFSQRGADSTGAIQFSESGLSRGVHALEVTAVDSAGLSARATVIFIVNGLPTEPAVRIDPSAPATDDALVVSFDSESVDPDGGEVDYTYAWSLDGAATAYTDASIPAAATARGERWSVQVTPGDEYGVGPAGEAEVTVQNTAPRITGVSLSPDPAYTLDALTCVYSGEDIDGDAWTASIAWTVGGAAVSASGEGLDGAWFERGDAVVCSVTPSDAADGGAAVDSAAVVIANSPPSAEGVEVAIVGDLLTAAPWGFSDADGDAEDYAFQWYADGVALPGEIAASLDLTAAAGAAYYVVATPWDGIDHGSPVTSSEVTAGNTPPVIEAASLSPDPAFTTDVIEVNATLSDADGDPVSLRVAWFVDGAEVAETGAALDGAIWFDAGQTVYAQLTPDDGVDLGAAVTTAAVEVLNTPPTAPSIAILPEAPVAGEDDLVCGIDEESEDLDGDAVSYGFAWEVDGEAYSGAAALETTRFEDDTAPAETTSEGEQWLCVVTPSDGEASGPQASVSVVIEGGGCEDDDEDGWSAWGCGGEDCDDGAPLVNPDAEEICGDGIDNDCDGVSEDCAGDTGECDGGYACCDVDGDGYYNFGCDGSDCDDGDPAVNPGGLEVCDGADNDCDEVVDEGCAPAGDTGGGDTLSGTFLVDWSSGEVVEPATISALISVDDFDSAPLVEVTGDDGDSLDLLVGFSEAGASTQDLCRPTLTAEADYEAPAFSAAFDAMDFSATVLGEDFDLSGESVSFSGTFAEDGASISGGRLAYALDTAPLSRLVDPADEGSFCDLVAGFGVPCFICPLSGNPYCMAIEIEDLEAALVDGLSLDEVASVCP